MSAAAWIALATALGVVLVLASDRFPAHRVALAGFAVLLISGVIDRELALEIVGSTGLVTVMCMFLIASALEHTGVVDDAVRRLLRLAGTRPTSAWALFFVLVLTGSMVVPNTPVVVLACPAALLLAQRTRTAGSRVLLPIAHLATLGGSVTIIGSSVNVVASELLEDHGGNAFDLATLAPIALPVAAAGALTVWLMARWLPAGPVAAALRYNPHTAFDFERVVAAGDPLVGKPLAQTLLLDPGCDVREFFPARPQGFERESGPALASFRPQVGDRLLLRASAEQLLSRLATEAPADPSMLVLEAWIPSYSRLCGLRVDQLRLESIYGVELLGVAALLGSVRDYPAYRIGTGDRLLIRGRRPEVERFLASTAVFGPLQVERSQQARDKAPLALGALAFVVLAPALGWLPLETAALIGAIVLTIGGVLRGGYQPPPLLLRTLGVLLGMLGIGAALESSGASTALVAPLIGRAAELGPWTLLVVVYIVASLVSEFITNNGVVVLLMPLALALAESQGLALLPFALAVLFGASASFATPIGYQTNTLVYQLGRYRFRDFLRIGLPLKLVVGIVTLSMIGFWVPIRAA